MAAGLVYAAGVVAGTVGHTGLTLSGAVSGRLYGVDASRNTTTPPRSISAQPHTPRPQPPRACPRPQPPRVCPRPQPPRTCHSLEASALAVAQRAEMASSADATPYVAADSVVPPTSSPPPADVAVVVSSNVRREWDDLRLTPVQRASSALPMIALVNPHSGGKMGATIFARLGGYVGV